MNTEKTIKQRIDRAQQIFWQVSSMQIEDDLEEVSSRLDQTEIDFLSLAYEAVSYKLGCQAQVDNFDRWNLFLNDYALKHSVQVHIGLGWSFTKENKTPLDFSEVILVENMQYVVDGCGFYHGLFNSQQAFDHKTVQEGMGDYYRYFDHGIGRSLWYRTEGKLEEVARQINSFSAERQANLWRGLTIAFTYIGGFNEQTVQQLFRLAEGYEDQLIDGIIGVKRIRTVAGTYDKYARLAFDEMNKIVVD